jgi:ABC-type transport system involved in Fe-S cluster assembly fused permease/ATPase subunit
MLVLIPFNFFANLQMEDLELLFRAILIIEIPYLVTLIYLLIKLWKKPNKTKSEKWTWTLLTILVFGPITLLIYLWNIEPDKSVKN